MNNNKEQITNIEMHLIMYKMHFGYFLLFGLLLAFLHHNAYSFSNKESKTKHALIVAISNYDQKTTGWQPLNAQNDIELIQNALIKQGFINENINVIVDEQANKKGIISALNHLQETVNKGDIVVIHYSGHGQQIFDNNSDELDGLDESIIPWGAPSSYDIIANYTGEKHIRDDEFGLYVKKIRLKVGQEGHVIVILDSCHSGTGTRGGKASIRGGVKPLTPPNYSAKKATSSNEDGFGLFTETPNQSRGSNEGIGKFILFTGANFNEINHETISESGKPVGSLSYAISKSLSDVSPNDTYRSIFANVQKIMADVAPLQNPTMEGDVDNKLFSGEVVEQEAYTKVLKINRNDKTWVVDVGEISGVSIGSKFIIYPAGTTNRKNAKALGVAIVIASNYFTSTVKSSYDLYNSKEVWLFVEKKSFSQHILRVNLSGISNRSVRRAISDKLSVISTITQVDQNEDILLSDRNGSGVMKIISKDTEFNCGSEIEECASSIKQYSIGHFLSNINHNDENYKMEIELIPVTEATLSSGIVKVGKTLSIDQFQTGIVPAFPEGTQLLLKVKNVGKKRIYFNILDLQPDGIINPVIPNDDAGISPEECVLMAGEEKIIPGFYIELYPPYGVETYKLFASRYPINLTPLLSEKPQNASRGGLSDLELLFSDALDGTRGSKSFSSNTGDGSIKNYVFKIVKK